MISVSSLPESIAVFPLPGALLLPRARLPLHIFEPRYLAMFEDALKTPLRLIGIVQPGAGNVLQTIGCAGRIAAFSETEDGIYMLTLTGISRFRVISEIESFLPYRKCNVDWCGFERDLGGNESDGELDRHGLLQLLERYLAAEALQTDWESLSEAEDELLINSLAMLCPFTPEDKQALLEAPCLKTRRETLTALLEFALHSGATPEVLQ